MISYPSEHKDRTILNDFLVSLLLILNFNLFYFVNDIGIGKIRDQKLRYYQAKRMLKDICIGLQNTNLDGALGDRVHQAIIQAIKQGNIKFVKKIIKSVPELMWKFDNDGRNIFSIATVYRQEKVFDLLQKLPNKRKLTFDIDKFGNTMLHLAAMLAPRDQLDGISGAALQMQRELHWFKVSIFSP